MDPQTAVNQSSWQYLLMGKNILPEGLLVCLHVGIEGFLVFEGLGTEGTLQHSVLGMGADVSLVNIAVRELYIAELALQWLLFSMCTEVKDKSILPRRGEGAKGASVQWWSVPGMNHKVFAEGIGLNKSRRAMGAPIGSFSSVCADVYL